METLNDLTYWRDWFESQPNKSIFPKLEALRWFIRKHHNEFTRAGALATVRGRLFVEPKAFEWVILGIMRESAKQMKEGV